MRRNSKHPGLILVGVVLGHLFTRSDSESGCPSVHPFEDKAGPSWGGDKKAPGC
jgi:hypothetical protein